MIGLSLGPVDVRETIRNPFEIYVYFAARGINLFFKIRAKLPIKSYVFRPSSQTSTGGTKSQRPKRVDTLVIQIPHQTVIGKCRMEY